MSHSSDVLSREQRGAPKLGSDMPLPTGPPADVGSTSCATITNPWVENGVEEISQQAAHDDAQREHDDDRFDDDHVLCLYRLYQCRAHARDGEDLLDQHRPSQENAEIESDERQQTEGRVSKCMADQDLPGSDALRTSGQDVVLSSHLVGEVCAQHPGVVAHQRESEG